MVSGALLAGLHDGDAPLVGDQGVGVTVIDLALRQLHRLARHGVVGEARHHHAVVAAASGVASYALGPRDHRVGSVVARYVAVGPAPQQRDLHGVAWDGRAHHASQPRTQRELHRHRYVRLHARQGALVRVQPVLHEGACRLPARGGEAREDVAREVEELVDVCEDEQRCVAQRGAHELVEPLQLEPLER
eukprot:scaffold18381_cov79-Phaeocystis_antarctica.AAC.4